MQALWSRWNSKVPFVFFALKLDLCEPSQIPVLENANLFYQALHHRSVFVENILDFWNQGEEVFSEVASSELSFHSLSDSELYAGLQSICLAISPVKLVGSSPLISAASLQRTSGTSPQLTSSTTQPSTQPTSSTTSTQPTSPHPSSFSSSLFIAQYNRHIYSIYYRCLPLYYYLKYLLPHHPELHDFFQQIARLLIVAFFFKIYI